MLSITLSKKNSPLKDVVLDQVPMTQVKKNFIYRFLLQYKMTFVSYDLFLIIIIKLLPININIKKETTKDIDYIICHIVKV